MTTMDRVRRWVWLINGVLLLGLLALTVVFVAGGWIRDLTTDDPGVAVSPRPPAGEERPRAVRYQLPRPVRGTDTRIVLIGHGRGYGSGLTGSRNEYVDPARAPLVNVAFLDAAGVRLLLDRPAYLSAVRWPEERAGSTPARDSLLRWVVYDMALEDGNGDGRLDDRDPASLYLSDLDGRNLRRVLPAGVRLHLWDVQADGSLFVTALAGAARGVDADELPQRAFVVSPDGRVRPHAALDSVAGAAGRILRN